MDMRGHQQWHQYNQYSQNQGHQWHQWHQFGDMDTSTCRPSGTSDQYPDPSPPQSVPVRWGRLGGGEVSRDPVMRSGRYKEPAPDPNRTGPGLDRIGTGPNPGPDRDWTGTGHRHRADRIGTRTGPDPDCNRTGGGWSKDRDWIADQNRIETRRWI